MFPQTFGTVALVVGAIWIVQGLGLMPTGSFMDGRPVWALAGAGLVLAGGISLLVRRRRGNSDADV